MVLAIPGVGAPDAEIKSITSVPLRGALEELLTGKLNVFLHGTIGNLFGISRGAVLMCLFAGLTGVLWRLIPDLPMFLFAWTVGTMPVWILPTAVAGAWKAWVWYIHSWFISTRTPVLLEVRMPRDLVKSPRAMEAVLSLLWIDASEVTFYNRKWQGAVRPIFSLEIASFGGEIHFYVWTWTVWRKIVEAAFYGQYPEVELVEVEDYASKYVYDPKKVRTYSTDFRYEPRNDAYPIKTYIEFELEKDPKEEYKIDPLVEILEFMGNLRPEEQIWVQIVFTCAKDVRRKPGGKFFETQNRYIGICQDEVENIRKGAIGEGTDLRDPKEEWRRFVRIQYYKQTEQIRIIERNMGKHSFNVGVRCVYIADRKVFSVSHLNKVKWFWMPFANPQYLNQLRPRRWHTPFDYPWQDLWDMRWDLAARRFFDCYHRRAHFYPPHVLPYNIMSTEVIATIWHPPSTAIKTPGIERLPARKAEPPPNLPR